MDQLEFLQPTIRSLQSQAALMFRVKNTASPAMISVTVLPFSKILPCLIKVIPKVLHVQETQRTLQAVSALSRYRRTETVRRISRVLTYRRRPSRDSVVTTPLQKEIDRRRSMETVVISSISFIRTLHFRFRWKETSAWSRTATTAVVIH